MKNQMDADFDKMMADHFNYQTVVIGSITSEVKLKNQFKMAENIIICDFNNLADMQKAEAILHIICELSEDNQKFRITAFAKVNRISIVF